jgi:DNA end-binding protein Ku
MRPIWKGHISFGLVTIPVSLYPAERSTDLHFHLLDSRNHARIHYTRINDETGQEVPWNEVVKAYEFDKDNYVVLQEKDLKQAAPEAVKTIEIQDFVALEKIPYTYFDRPYYLVPDQMGEKAFVLLREALKLTKKVGIAKVVIREKQYLAAIIPTEKAIVLNLLRYHQELLDINQYTFPSENLKDYHIKNAELEMAKQLINDMSHEWVPSQYQDEYRLALLQWIEEKSGMNKAKTKSKKEAINKQDQEKIIDFADLLKQSLAKAKKTKLKISSPKIAKMG